jgi:hypothetical protein
MYRVINANVSKVLGEIKPETDVQPYVWLNEKFTMVDVSADEQFQRRFRQYWQLNVARLSENFLRSYFTLLQGVKGENDASIEAVVDQLYRTPTRADGRSTLQFSFASKLVHTLRPHAPIYAREVHDFFFFPAGPQTEPLEEKRGRLLAAYHFLEGEYQRVLNKGLLAQSIALFRERFDPKAVFTGEKVIDTLIWRFVTLLRSGRLPPGAVLYG